MNGLYDGFIIILSPDIKCWAFRNAIRVSLIDSVKDITERETMKKIAHLIEEIRSIDGKNILGKLIDSSKAGKSINPKIVDDIAFQVGLISKTRKQEK